MFKLLKNFLSVQKTIVFSFFQRFVVPLCVTKVYVAQTLQKCLKVCDESSNYTFLEDLTLVGQHVWIVRATKAKMKLVTHGTRFDIIYIFTLTR